MKYYILELFSILINLLKNELFFIINFINEIIHNLFNL